MVSTPSAAKNITFHPSAIICVEAVIEGEVTIGAGTIIHPFAIIRATKGPIVIGENNNIDERCVIENISEGQIMIIGDENIMENGAHIQASSIGNKNCIHGKSKVGPGVIISNGCSIGPKCQLMEKGSIPEKTVIWGAENRRRIAHDYLESFLPHFEQYRKMLPSYHHIHRHSSKN